MYLRLHTLMYVRVGIALPAWYMGAGFTIYQVYTNICFWWTRWNLARKEIPLLLPLCWFGLSNTCWIYAYHWNLSSPEFPWIFWSFATLTLLDSRNSFFSLLCRFYILSTGPWDDDLPIRFFWWHKQRLFYRWCKDGDLPILDGWHGQLPLGKILCVMFLVSHP